jgi:hypothetical protein
MKRTQIQLEEPVFEQLREEAFQEHTSIADVVRRILREHVPSSSQKVPSVKRQPLSFIGLGVSKGKGAGNIAECHDEELAESLLP